MEEIWERIADINREITFAREALSREVEEFVATASLEDLLELRRFLDDMKSPE